MDAAAQSYWMMMFGHISPLVISEPAYRHTGCYAREDTIRVEEQQEAYQVEMIKQPEIKKVIVERDKGELTLKILRLFDDGEPVRRIPALVGSSLRYVRYVLVKNDRKEPCEKRRSPVARYTKGGKFLTRYDSVNSAARSNGLTKYIVSKSAQKNGGMIVGKAYVFKYVQEEAAY